MRRLMGIAAVIVVAGVVTYAGTRAAKGQAAGHQGPGGTATHVMIAARDVKFGPGPPALPPGAQIAVLDGDPGKAAPFTMRAKLADGYKVPPHWHPTDEHLVILSGTLMMGVGDKMNEGSMHPLTAGAYAKMPKQTNHYVMAKGETMFQISGMGPFEVTYVNPSDDPRKATTK